MNHIQALFYINICITFAPGFEPISILERQNNIA